ncbi:hypothetical protein D3C81_1442500 [compost metagenome]
MVLVPDLGVVHVARIRGDVEVAHHDQLRMPLQFFGDPRVHRLQPAQLVLVFAGADVLAVDHIQVDHPQVAEGAGDDPLLLVLEAGDADLHVLRRLARHQRHTVVGLLASEHAAVTGGDQRRVRELVVLQLGFLDADDVRAEVLEPLLQVRQADIERIDVPRGDLHAGILTGPALVDANLGWRWGARVSR